MESIFGAIFAFVIGSVGIWVSIRGLRNRLILKTWKTTAGRVIERGTFVVNYATTDVAAYLHSPLVRYAYTVEGKEMQNTDILPRRIQLAQSGTNKWAQSKADTFPNDVTVHYNPEDPSEAYLVLTTKRILYLVIVASCMAILFGIALLMIRFIK